MRKVMGIVIFMQFSAQHPMFNPLDYMTFAIGASIHNQWWCGSCARGRGGQNLWP